MDNITKILEKEAKKAGAIVEPIPKERQATKSSLNLLEKDIEIRILENESM
ncbi:MAG TPA: hypothetical protein PK993_05445 [Clostridia bacterium]|nr:hypothetical protein [Clostridia bacterium]